MEFLVHMVILGVVEKGLSGDKNGSRETAAVRRTQWGPWREVTRGRRDVS